MKFSLLIVFAVAAVFTSAQQVSAQESEAVLEQYVFGTGQNSSRVTATLRDKSFGGGTARASLSFLADPNESGPRAGENRLMMTVRRNVPPDQITFALLCFRIEIRGYDVEGAEVFSKDLPGFTFGDSASGFYSKAIRGIPKTVSELQVTFVGNYE